MPTGSPLQLAHPKLTALPTGTILWHVHPATFSPTAFNPASENRFSARKATIPRSMYYAGVSANVAIWETILRDVVADQDGTVALFESQLAGKQLAQVRTNRKIPIIDLTMPGLRLHADKSQLATWQALQTAFPYEETHIAAATLLEAHGNLGGLAWTSKQAGSGRAFVFYDPPDSDCFTQLAVHPLDGMKGWKRIDQALAKAGITRIPTDPHTLGKLT